MILYMVFREILEEEKSFVKMGREENELFSVQVDVRQRRVMFAGLFGGVKCSWRE